MNGMFRAGAVAGLVVIAFGCGGGRVAPAPDMPARLYRVAAEQIALGADEAAQAAMANLDSGRLALYFSGRALRTLVDQVGWLRARGLRSETSSTERAIASFDGAANEVVIQIEAEHRLASHSEPDPPWSRAIRLWWARLGFASGGWRVVDDTDLPPDQWRPIADGPA
jgi:hypothetical protein